MNETLIETGRSMTQFKARSEAPLVPASQATAAQPAMSQRYTFVPTARIVAALENFGWTAVRSQQVRVRDEERRGYQKHAVWFRQDRRMESMQVDDICVELLLINAHDGSSSYRLQAGIYRAVCANGLVVGESTYEAIRFPHLGSNPEKVAEASLHLAGDIPRIMGRINEMRNRDMTSGQQIEFAERALGLRYPKDPPVNPQTLLHVRRNSDSKHDLWTTMNRVQENLLQGGPDIRDDKRTVKGRIRSVRRCGGIDASVWINRGIWTLADSFLDHAAFDAYALN